MCEQLLARERAVQSPVLEERGRKKASLCCFKTVTPKKSLSLV